MLEQELAMVGCYYSPWRTHRCCSGCRLFGVEDGFEEQDADGGEDDVVAGQLLDPGADLDGVEVGGEDAGGGLNHRQKGGQRDGEEQQREQEFAVAGAKAEGGEEGSVDDERPGAERAG